MKDSALIRLARLTKVKAHHRRSGSGKSEQVDSYVRKQLDPYGPGANAKTRAGAYAAQATSVDKTQLKPQNRGGGSRAWKAKELVREIESRGGRSVRQSGSHLRFEAPYPGGKAMTIVPMHSGKDVATGTMRKIEKDMEIAFGKGWLNGQG